MYEKFKEHEEKLRELLYKNENGDYSPLFGNNTIHIYNKIQELLKGTYHSKSERFENITKTYELIRDSFNHVEKENVERLEKFNKSFSELEEKIIKVYNIN